MLKTLAATRYVTPLREGGSLPAIVEAEDGALYVMKFVGAGQGAKALTAEVLAGAVALRLGLDVPDMVLLTLDPAFGRNERHQEIQDLLRASEGINLGFRYLPGAYSYNVLLQPPVADELASRIVWFDAYVTNVDRTPRNVNLLLAEKRLWLIDHGAALYFHHSWDDVGMRAATPFSLVREHTLLPFASRLREQDEPLRALLDDATLEEIVMLPPDAWLEREHRVATPAEQRLIYREFLTLRRDASAIFVEEAANAHASLL